MSLHIDQLSLALPVSLTRRKAAIVQLLRSELAQYSWPTDVHIAQMTPADISISPQHTNLRIAKAIAQQIHLSTKAYARRGESV